MNILNRVISLFAKKDPITETAETVINITQSQILSTINPDFLVRIIQEIPDEVILQAIKLGK